MEQFTGLIGIALIYILAYVMSNRKQEIPWRLVISGSALQLIVAIFILKLPIGQALFHQIGQIIQYLLSFATQGASFVFGPLVSRPEVLNRIFGNGSGFIFAFNVVPTIIFVSALVAMAYHLGLMQRAVQGVAWFVYKIMGASGSEALSNSASAFVGQVEAQLLIKPYLPTMTKSELFAVMSGSMACISGGVMAAYIQMGIPAEYLLTASAMAIPGALVLSKIIYPEREFSVTRGKVHLALEQKTVNLFDAATQGASDGLKIGLNVCAMLIAFIALIQLLNAMVHHAGLWLASQGMDLSNLGINLSHLSLSSLIGSLFSLMAVALGVPYPDARLVGGLMGTKMILNEFVAYSQMTAFMHAHLLQAKSIAIASFALCGFANLSSVAILIGGVGQMVPKRKSELARLGLKAMICGTMASYISSALAGILIAPHDLSVSSDDSTLLSVGLMVAALIVILVTNHFAEKKSMQPSNPFA